jgi:hypothetical protein
MKARGQISKDLGGQTLRQNRPRHVLLENIYSRLFNKMEGFVSLLFVDLAKK